MTQKVEQMAENVMGKGTFNNADLNVTLLFLVKDTVASVKETLTGTYSKEEARPVVSPMDAAKINPMDREPSRDPISQPQEPLNKKTEELQKKGAERKAEEDSYNLM